MCSWGKFWTKDIKGPKNPTATFEEPGAKAGYCTCPLHTPPKGWAKHLSHPSNPTPGHTATLTPYKEPARPSSGSEQGNLLSVLAPPCCSRRPNKVLPEFLVWPLVHFYSLGKAKNPGWYHCYLRPPWWLCFLFFLFYFFFPSVCSEILFSLPACHLFSPNYNRHFVNFSYQNAFPNS